MSQEMLSLLEELCPPLGPPGREDEIRDHLAGVLGPLAREIGTDRLGNLQAWFGPAEGPLVMLDAHMDETAFMVQRVDDKGFIKAAPLGGVDPRIMPGSRVVIQAEPGMHLEGVVALAPPHVAQKGDADKSIPWDQLFFDCGFASDKEAWAAGVVTGACGVVDAGQGRLAGDRFRARNLDDRAGCAVLVALARRLAQAPPRLRVVMNFAVAEEVGLRGATTAAYGLDPDLALVVEATVGDTPGVDPGRNPTLLGKGPGVTVADGRIVVPARMVASLEAAAERAGVACQRKLPPYGGTDAGAIHVARAGIPTGVLSVPVRYIHTPVSLLDLNDLAAMVELTAAWLEGAGELL